MRMQARPALAIVAIALGGAVVYGIAHDLVTASLSPEYFTVGHGVVASTSPILLALFWGPVASWWLGLALGVPLALACRLGSWPTLRPRQAAGLVAAGLVATGAAALAAGVTESMHAGAVVDEVRASWREVPRGVDDPRAYEVAWAMHGTSYFAGALAGIAACAAALAWRWRLAHPRGPYLPAWPQGWRWRSLHGLWAGAAIGIGVPALLYMGFGIYFRAVDRAAAVLFFLGLGLAAAALLAAAAAHVAALAGRARPPTDP